MKYLYAGLIGGLIWLLSRQWAWRLEFAPLSAWEIYRQQTAKLTTHQQCQLERWRAYPALRSLLWLATVIESGVLLVAWQQVGGDYAGLGWLGSIGLAWLGARVRWSWLSSDWYRCQEERWLALAKKMKPWQLPMLNQPQLQPLKLTSRAEFNFLVRQDQAVLRPVERSIIMAANKFVTTRVSAVMTPLEQLESVEAGELLGPLKINELYQTGERLFIVKKTQQVMGLISLADLTDLRANQSCTASQLARQNYLELAADLDLITAVNRLLEYDTSVALVANKTQILGIIKLETILKQLKIVNL